MRLAKKYPVPPSLALLYEFVNSLDLRRFEEHGSPHEPGDELVTPAQLESWLRERRLWQEKERMTPGAFRAALELRQSIRDLLALNPGSRRGATETLQRLSAAAQRYPLVLVGGEEGVLRLGPAAGVSGLARVLVELHGLEDADRLDRLKMCASQECHWVFYDRSKPGNRRWCSSALCGNRDKTRNYRARKQQAV
jgi:predicted RNA-binding Zn ribbon-like protein